MILSVSVIISMLCILWLCLCISMYLSNPIKRCSEALSWFYRHGNAKMRHNRSPVLHELSPRNAIPSRRRSPFFRERGQLQKGISRRIELWSARREFLVHFISTEIDKIANCSPAWYSQWKNDQSNMLIPILGLQILLWSNAIRGSRPAHLRKNAGLYARSQSAKQDVPL